MTDMGHVEYLGHVEYIEHALSVLSDIKGECSGDLSAFNSTSALTNDDTSIWDAEDGGTHPGHTDACQGGSSEETSTMSLPGIEEWKSSIESDIFLVTPIKLTFAGSDFNSEAEHFVDQSITRSVIWSPMAV